MSMPMICSAAARASSGVRASLMPPALPRPPTGTCALTATGPSSPAAPAASSGVRATLPGGMGMPSEASTSFAWYSSSFIDEDEGYSQRDVAVPAGSAAALLALGQAERAHERRSRRRRLDHLVQVAPLRRDVRVGEPVGVV